MHGCGASKRALLASDDWKKPSVHPAQAGIGQAFWAAWCVLVNMKVCMSVCCHAPV